MRIHWDYTQPQDKTLGRAGPATCTYNRGLSLKPNPVTKHGPQPSYTRVISYVRDGAQSSRYECLCTSEEQNKRGLSLKTRRGRTCCPYFTIQGI